jgi:hypothetical protein
MCLGTSLDNELFYRYSQFYLEGSFCRYNMFNHHFFDGKVRLNNHHLFRLLVLINKFRSAFFVVVIVLVSFFRAYFSLFRLFLFSGDRD